MVNKIYLGQDKRDETTKTNSTHTNRHSTERRYKVKAKEVKRSTRTYKREFQEIILKESEEGGRQNLKMLYDMTKRLSGRGNKITIWHKYGKKEGKLFNKKINTWVEYFEAKEEEMEWRG